MSIAPDDIIFLLGAGASAEAGIPTSADMIGKIEYLLNKEAEEEWRPFQSLYNHVKSGIYYAEGLRGRFRDDVSYNIETLVNTLYELERNEEHPLYPFIAAWNSRFVALAGADFSNVKSFRGLILRELQKWMCPDNPLRANYYQGLANLQKEITFPLRVFSLNYDLCVEHLACDNFQIETGFGGYGPEHAWNFERFETTTPGTTPQIIFYKLHGSINWKRDDETKNLFRVDQAVAIEPDRMELIFGRDFRLEAADPYLFYAYEFRRCTLAAKLIVAIGYGFGDAHINKMLTQALRKDGNRRLLAVCNCDNEDGVLQKKRVEICRKLDNEESILHQVDVQPGTTKQFLETKSLVAILSEKLPVDSDTPF